MPNDYLKQIQGPVPSALSNETRNNPIDTARFPVQASP
ncbi:hypothetical protein SynA1560_01649 [Synechococcus sp. A15-60]|nr:hypothetical protein SynA1560_01649 [Synechococcus sp. A15-60]